MPAPPRSPSAPRCASVRPARRTSRAAFCGDPPPGDDPLLGFAPYVHAAPRRNSITPDRQRAFIAALAASGIVTQAARAIGASLEALYRLRALPGAEQFAAAWEAAVERGLARLEDCAVELALRGEELPIVSGGRLLGTYRKHNFAHIRFMLSQRRPDRYGPKGGPVSLADLPPDDPGLLRLKARWRAEWEAEQRAAAEVRRAGDEAFLRRLNQRFEVLRQKSLAIERGEWTDPEAAARLALAAPDKAPPDERDDGG
ncbi:hypothetical protein B0I00_1074 [Novosphingobium kunmingense]|uniref:Uncharacterized protein n=1 Tax=Novosphingobium kunmingense TaxID=1211806 RepID=A0A2N0I3V6_9SPHN|nr:hypothetical protein [Novosphingobium kunmingense]PKB25867.1 hypothetical protein B0I00_1074 [Novosphingobium kunmingense]